MVHEMPPRCAYDQAGVRVASCSSRPSHASIPCRRAARSLAALAASSLVAGTGFAGGGYFPSSWGWPTLAAGWAAALALTAGAGASLEPGRCGRRGSARSVRRLDRARSDLVAQRHADGALGRATSGLRRRSPGGAALGAPATRASRTRSLGSSHRSLRLGTDDEAHPRPLRRRRRDLRLSAVRADRLLELARAARRDRRAARRSGSPRGQRRCSVARARRRVRAVARRDALLHLQPRRLDCARSRAARSDRARPAPAAAPGSRSAWSPPLTAFAVWRASVSSALTTPGSPLSAMTHEGHRLAVVLAAIALAVAAATCGVALLERRVARALRVCKLIEAGLAAAAVVAAVGSRRQLRARRWQLARTSVGRLLDQRPGSIHEPELTAPAHLRHRADDAVERRLARRQGASLARLRRRHVRAGLESRAAGREQVRNVHNLYLETLAELGPFGLALLVARARAAARRRRSRPRSPARLRSVRRLRRLPAARRRRLGLADRLRSRWRRCSAVRRSSLRPARPARRRGETDCLLGARSLSRASASTRSPARSRCLALPRQPQPTTTGPPPSATPTTPPSLRPGRTSRWVTARRGRPRRRPVAAGTRRSPQGDREEPERLGDMARPGTRHHGAEHRQRPARAATR